MILSNRPKAVKGLMNKLQLFSFKLFSSIILSSVPNAKFFQEPSSAKKQTFLPTNFSLKALIIVPLHSDPGVNGLLNPAISPLILLISKGLSGA